MRCWNKGLALSGWGKVMARARAASGDDATAAAAAAAASLVSPAADESSPAPPAAAPPAVASPPTRIAPAPAAAAADDDTPTPAPTPAPAPATPPPPCPNPMPLHSRSVAVQVEFESKGLKPGFHFTGSSVETRRFQAMGKLHSTCTASPQQDVRHGDPEARVERFEQRRHHRPPRLFVALEHSHVLLILGLHSLPGVRLVTWNTLAVINRCL
jgi:hypothetical protein